MEGVAKLLRSNASLVVKSDVMGLNQDMDQPLNHYFVSSSHNTFLSGKVS